MGSPQYNPHFHHFNCLDQQDGGGVCVRQVTPLRISTDYFIKPLLFSLKRSPFVDAPILYDQENVEEFYAKMAEMPSPRIIKV